MNESTAADKKGTTSFFAPAAAVVGGRITLPPEEARHAVRVLRVQVGDEIEVVDGEGGWYRVRLLEAGRQRVTGEILERRREVGEPALNLEVGLALLKQPGRYETFFEKAVEIGVSRVVPLITSRSEQKKINARRLYNLGVAATKQCGRSRLVQVAEPQAFAQYVREGEAGVVRLICHELTSTTQSLLRALRAHRGSRSVRVLVGPEGGFSADEMAAAEGAGFLPVSLGPRRLRAETAAIVAASLVMAVLEPGGEQG